MTISDSDSRSTVEYLLESNFRPSRTVVLAFGFDEEVGGTQVDRLMHVRI